MSYETFPKAVIARIQLDAAITLYFDAHDYISAISLAGAAEEILGQLLRARGIIPSLDSFTAAVTAIHALLHGTSLAPKSAVERANRARNALKHHDPSQEDSVTLDVEEEAKDLITRAIDNYWLLTTDLPPLMRRFQDSIISLGEEGSPGEAL